MSQAPESRQGDREHQDDARRQELTAASGPLEQRELLNRLLWRCRQGTRELDTILLGFVESEKDSLSSDDIAALDRLLECSQSELIRWLIGGAMPESRLFQSVAHRIHRYAKPR